MTALLGLAEVAARLNVSRTTAWRLVQSGEIPSIPITPTLRRVDPQDLEEWIASRRERGPTPADIVQLKPNRESDLWPVLDDRGSR